MKLFNRLNLLNPGIVLRVLLHVLFWDVLAGLRAYLTLITFNVYGGFSPSHILLLNIASTSFIAAFYYVITGPVWKLFTQKRHAAAIIAMLAAVIIYTVLDAAFERLVIQGCAGCLAILQSRQPGFYRLMQSGLVNTIFKRLLSLGTPASLLLTISIPLCIKMALKGWRSQVMALELAKQNVELEFSFLKAQINPHFLFNTMNNIYGLILKEDTARSAELVARLSAMLRYMLYETDEKRMPVDKEIKLLNDYIALEKIRLNETVVSAQIQIAPTDYTLPPLLLMPLVENAFKYCSDGPAAYIHLVLSVKQCQLQLTLHNTVDRERLNTAANGIGLVNFHKRLKLYYDGRYSYKAGLQDGVYSVHLSIDLL